MIKKYLLDIISIVLVSTVALLATQKPATELKLRPSSPSIGDKGKLPDVKKEEKEKVQTGIIKEVAAVGSLKERNIFSADGSYAISGAVLKGPLPENPYTLIGILQGEEKKAVFRDYKGSIITLAVGKTLIDGSVITRIDRLSVAVEKKDEKRELKMFDLTDPARRTPPKPEIASKAKTASKPEEPEEPPRGTRRSRERRPDQKTPQKPGQTPQQRR